ncbi:acyltransferase [Acidovorax sp. NB1]|uniref:acyltransferase family protein n=1 Tax=Acidovorax sp. NB1 TaxID=1943571 RepID=UPI0010F4FB73|nr:acyltransferase [Acidovorax sp. NB1]
MIQSIQVLRFFAAMWVVVYHAQGWPQLPDMNEYIRAFFAWGFVGVDIFFVISGCVMAIVLNQFATGRREALQFFAHRLVRIYLGWWPIFLMYCCWLAFTGQLGSDKDLFNSFFLFLAPPQNLVTAVLWTLTFELYFYGIMSALVLLKVQYRDLAVKIVFLGVAGYTLLMTLQHRFEPENVFVSTSAMRFWASPLLLEFLGGFMVYRCIEKNTAQSRAGWLAAVLALSIVSAAYHQFFARHPGGLEVFYHYPDRVVLVGAAACSLLGLILLLPRRNSSRWNSLALAAGGISYAIYLSHPLVFSLSSAVFGSINPENIHKKIMYLCMLTALVGICLVYHYFLERPLHLWGRKMIDKSLGAPTRKQLNRSSPAAPQ